MTLPVSTGPYEVAEFFLAACLAELDACGSDPITTAYCGVGLPAWDDCCGQLVVTPDNIFRSTTFPQEDTTDDRCDGATIAVEISAMLLRCVPTMDDRGRAPAASVLAAAHKRVLDDAGIMWAAMTAPLPVDFEWDRGNVRQSVVSPTGGCVAIETRCLIGVASAQWCVDC